MQRIGKFGVMNRRTHVIKLQRFHTREEAAMEAELLDSMHRNNNSDERFIPMELTWEDN